LKKALAEIRDALAAGSWQGRAIKKLDAAYEACRRLDNYDATDSAWDEPTAPLSAEKLDEIEALARKANAGHLGAVRALRASFTPAMALSLIAMARSRPQDDTSNTTGGF
jgi:hypothetical protein